MFYTFITIPNVASTLSSIGEWSTALFAELLPIALIIVGLIVGALIAKALLRGSVGAVKSFTGGGRRDRRGRR